MEEGPRGRRPWRARLAVWLPESSGERGPVGLEPRLCEGTVGSNVLGSRAWRQGC